jgi:hypothetical protein
MIEHLNSVRDCFEELSPELGVIDLVSGLVATQWGLMKFMLLSEWHPRSATGRLFSSRRLTKAQAST